MSPLPDSSRHPRHRGRVYAHCTSRTGRHTVGRPFKSSPSAPCSVCGDDPVTNAGGDADAFDRIRYDLDQDWPYVGR